MTSLLGWSVRRGYPVGVGVEGRRLAAERERRPRPQRGVVAVGVEVPAGAAAGRPDGAPHPALHVGVVLPRRVLGHLHRGVVVSAHGPDGVDDVGHLGLDHEHHAGVPEPGVRTDDEEQVGEVGDRGALVGGHPRLPPLLGQRLPGAAGDVLGDRQLGGVEAGGDDQHVDRALHAVLGHDRIAGDLGDAVGHQVDVVGVQRRVVGVGDQDPLAADLEGRGDLLAQLGVVDAALDVLQRQLLGRPGELGLQREPGHVGLAAPVDRGPVERLHAGDPLERGLLDAGVGPVVARHHVRRGALVDVEVADLLLDRRDDLDRRRAGADHRDPLARQVDVVVPAGGVEHLALEGLDALDLGQLRLREAAGAADHRAGGVRAAGRLHHPALPGVVPGRVLGEGVEDEPVQGAGPLGHPLDVGLDLRLRGEGPRPVGVGREGVRVELARHVALRAGVGVVAPGAADVVALLDHHEVGLTGLLELDRRTEPGEAGPDDQVVDLADEGGLGHGADAIGVIEHLSIDCPS